MRHLGGMAGSKQYPGETSFDDIIATFGISLGDRFLRSDAPPTWSHSDKPLGHLRDP